MKKVNSLTDLKKLQIEFREKYNIRDMGSAPENQVNVKVAMATCGIASGAKEIMDFFLEELDKRNIDAIVTQTGCMGYCYAEPTIEITLPGKEPVVFGFVDIRRADEIIEKYIKNGEFTDGVIPVNYQTIDNI